MTVLAGSLPRLVMARKHHSIAPSNASTPVYLNSSGDSEKAESRQQYWLIPALGALSGFAMTLPLRCAASLRLAGRAFLCFGLRPDCCGQRPLDGRRSFQQVRDLPRIGVAEP